MPVKDDGSFVEGNVDLAGGGLDLGVFFTSPASWRVEAVAWSTRSRNASALPASSENQDDISSIQEQHVGGWISNRVNKG